MRKTHHHRSLDEVHESVDTSGKRSRFGRILAFLGPAYLISVGYMDPGNWATDLAGGSRYGYALIWVLLMSNIMALLLQSLSARLGIVRGRDLAQASAETYPPVVNFFLYFLAEIAIAACDLAEVIGMAIGLQLLFDIPLIWGVCLTVFDSFILLFLISKGMRKMEAFIIALISVIGLCFVVEMILAKPDMSELVTGFVPTLPDDGALYIAIGIIGATVMPHNLYLHSSLVQSRKFEHNRSGIRQAIRFNFIDSAIALNLAFFVNAAILILAAAVFYNSGHFEVAEIQDAHQLLHNLLGTKWAPILFALALIAAGQSSTLTGTLAGQIVMEGYLNLRIQPWVRRLITRLLAIVPALITILWFGPDSTGELLVLSQVVLSLQLGFAMIPLIHFVSDKNLMNGFEIKWPTRIVSWLVTLVIVGLNAKLVFDEMIGWIQNSEDPIWIYAIVLPLVIGAVVLLLYITFMPWLRSKGYVMRPSGIPHSYPVDISLTRTDRFYKQIAIAIDFTDSDKKSLTTAFRLGGTDATYHLIHVVETAGALVYGKQIDDLETEKDLEMLNAYVQEFERNGSQAKGILEFGKPSKAIAAVVNAPENKIDLLIMGRHGHDNITDLIFGTTVNRVRHKVKIPVFIT
ncbi:Nramp family divalent metal transporter [Robertkochia solimangrovi]|uniref:Nramp family divalent metal transporter n=1 Tax=Robertkochia solimangrovi TaxID=2213046 RepID=UPI00117D17D9|nr:Nramp family divalent metal transporter [Robertkochia solimangrovi]TRZ41315.1 iron/manganese transporter [Robertkochia solimangrovi]